MIKLCIGCCIALVGVNLCAQNKDADVVSSGVERVWRLSEFCQNAVSLFLCAMPDDFRSLQVHDIFCDVRRDVGKTLQTS